MEKQKCSIMWFRRDLRLHDNMAFCAALKAGVKVLPLFIFDKNILDKLDDKDDARVTFIHETLQNLKEQLQDHGSDILIEYGKPKSIYKKILETYDIQSIYTNRDYEPYADERDDELHRLFEKKGVDFLTFKDQCLFEKNEVVKDDGKPYVVFTPYKRKHLSLWTPETLKTHPSEKHLGQLLSIKKTKLPSLESMGFTKSNIEFSKPTCTAKDLHKYAEERDFPPKDAGTYLGIHLRFGTISIRKLAKTAQKHSDIFLSELIWRDFFMQILYHYPHVVKGAFRPEYDSIKWRNVESEYKKWCEGKTGFPLVDAGMRELNKTGYMHNRVRMLVASFLTKHLLIDWRWGERYFARKLLDFELSSNNGNWQWAAGCGCDAAPYFRVFNPTTQIKKFDSDHVYIKKWVPEFETKEYPEPMVDHKMARERALSTYKMALKK